VLEPDPEDGWEPGQPWQDRRPEQPRPRPDDDWFARFVPVVRSARARLVAVLAAAVWFVLGGAGPAYADNCSGLSDCSFGVKIALAVGAIVLVAIAIMLLPELLAGAGAEAAATEAAAEAAAAGEAVAGEAAAGEVVAGEAVAGEAAAGEAAAGEAAAGEAAAGETAAGESAAGESAAAEGQSVESQFGSKINKQMPKRGWNEDSVRQTIDRPARTVRTTDARWQPDGSKVSEEATAYINRDGSYVVRNNRTGDIVQISNRNDPGWISPFE
jgi:cell division septation protein DedD